MKNPFKDLLSKEGKKILSRYEKPTKKFIDHVDGIVGGMEYKMKEIREHGDPSRTILASETLRKETYEYVQCIRKTVAGCDDIVKGIQDKIVEINNGITTIEKSESISLLITDFEKEIIIKSLMRLINYLRVAQAKLDGARIMIIGYTESILQNIDKGSTHLIYTYDSDKKEWHLMVGYSPDEDASNSMVEGKTESGNPETPENTENSSEQKEDSGSKAKKDGTIAG